MTSEKQHVTIDGKQYPLEDLSETAKNQIVSIQAADQRINALRQELAFVQTARNSYVKALSENLPEVSDDSATAAATED